MTDTGSALQRIDASEFETLVTWYLRRSNTQLVGLIATGTNEEGKPVPCKVDGVVSVPDSPARCIAVAATTTKRKRLSGKWLGDESDRGDIQKAIEEFQPWKAEDPEVVCVLYLATNRWLGSDTDLYRRAIQHGHDNKVNVMIVEASILVDFLEHDPEGQYLRQEILGIDANRLSDSLLRKIAQHSLQRHRLTFSVGLDGDTEAIERDAHTQLMELVGGGSNSLICLQGASGIGKSTLLRQIGSEVNTNGGVALWVPAEEITAGDSIGAILLRTLRRFHPALNLRAGEDALRLAFDAPFGLVLLVDDINRLPSPTLAFRSIEALIEDGQGEVSLGSDGLRLCFVVPLWPSQLAAVQGESFGKHTKWKFADLHPYSSRERTDLVKLSTSSQPELRQIIDALDGDPLLCGLAAADAVSLGGASRSDLMREIFENFMRHVFGEAANASRIAATPNEFASAVEDLIGLMLRASDPEPKWHQVRAQLGHRTADLLHELATRNQLGWIDEHDGLGSWRWIHNRLRDVLVGRWLARNAIPQVGEDSISAEVLAWLADPGLAEAWAVTTVFLPARDLQIKVLEHLAAHQPLASAVALRLGIFPHESEPRRVIEAGIRHALANFDPRIQEFVGGSRWEILGELAETDDPLVLEVTDDLPGHWYVWAARLRNGDIDAGLKWLSYESRGDFMPCMNHPLLEGAMEALALRYEQERHYIAVELVNASVRSGLPTAAITLAGYLAWQELAKPVWKLWSALSDRDKLIALTPTVWALSRCAAKSDQPKLEEALLWSLELSDEQRVEGKSHRASDRYRMFMSPLRLALRWPITSEAAETWAQVASERADLRKTMCFLLRGIDHPATLDVYVRWSGEQGGTLWDDASELADPLSEHGRTPRIPVRTETRNHLWAMVRNEQNQDIRNTAFRFWKRSASRSDLEQLRSVSSDDALFDEVLKVRLRLRDGTAAEPLIERMDSQPGKWCDYGAALYDHSGVRKAFLDNLKSALDDPNSWSVWSIHAPRHLPREGVKQLVRQKRDLLLKSRQTWLSLWRSDVPDALALVREAMSTAPPEDLEYFFDRSEVFPFPVSPRMLNSLVPAIDRLNKRERERLAWLAAAAGYVQWVEEHLPDMVAAETSRHFVTTGEDIVAALDSACAAIPDGPRAVYDSGIFRAIHAPGPMIDPIETTRRWLESSSDSNRLIVAAMILMALGSGLDIGWWQGVEPLKNDSAHTPWGNALYFLMRRRWQS